MEAKLLTAERFVDKISECSYRYVISTTEYFRPHYHDYYELFVILDGTAYHNVNGNEIKLTKGDMVFIRPDDIHNYSCENNKTFSMMNITLSTKTVSDMFSFLGDAFPSATLNNAILPPNIHLSNKELDWFNLRMDSICAIEGEKKQELKTAMRILLFKIFTRFFSDIDSSKEGTPVWLDELLDNMR